MGEVDTTRASQEVEISSMEFRGNEKGGWDYRFQEIRILF
jgi:hypothetical protein